ncbi:MAG: c-type cytochrome [Verrucomicrobiales bacterium]
MRYFLLGFLLVCALVVGFAGFRGEISRKPGIEVFPDMDRQPKIRPQKPSSFFADGKASRLPVEGTVARGSHFIESEFTTGMVAGTTNYVAWNPMQVTEQLMLRGKQRYDINCLPCHGAIGDGNGITKKFGMAVVANLHDQRIVEMGDGEMFHVITHGRNLMGPYGPNVVVEDRWAIVAYVRALQLARLGSAQDLPEAQRAAFAK